MGISGMMRRGIRYTLGKREICYSANERGDKEESGEFGDRRAER